MRIVVSGVTSLPPFSPGIALDWIQYAVGLSQLGHDVYYVEQVERDWCVDEHGNRSDFEGSQNQRLFRSALGRFDLFDRASLVFDGGEATFGMTFDEVLEVATGADLLINHSGHMKLPQVLDAVKCRAYVDQDPIYTQLWRAEYGEDLDLDVHDVFFTMGLNIGTDRTHIPDCGIEWHPILPPVVLDCWEVAIHETAAAFTTIASWTGYSDLEYEGVRYGSKYVEFDKFAPLPTGVDQEFEIALKNFRDDDPGIRRLRENGWRLSDASKIDDIDSYRSHIQRSRAEIGIAQNAYVQGRSGWFSDRAAHYLASGKPVLAQLTGFEDVVPVGEGLLGFSDLDDAIKGVEEINSRYTEHCRAARSFAERHLDASNILPQFLEIARS